MNNKDSTSSFPLEILNKIFDYINYHNEKHLFNCALVNSTWCILIIPLIWSKPFNRKRISQCEKYDKFNNIIGTYVNLLDENTKLQLGLFDCTNRIMFDYCIYMKEFDSSELFNAVRNWIINKCLLKSISIDEVEIRVNNISYELLKLFFRKCTNLYYVSLDSTIFENINIKQKSTLFENCFQFNSLTRIRIGEIYNKQIFVNYLCKQCNLIEEIFINLSDKDSKCKIENLLEGLIIKQKILKIFHCNSSANFQLNATRIIEALINNDNYKNNLSYIEFAHCLFECKTTLYRLSCLKNLKFELIECKIFNNESNNFDYPDENFIINYFNYIPEIVDFDFDEVKNSNTIVVTTRLTNSL